MERTTPIAAQRPVTAPALLHSVPLFLKKSSLPEENIEVLSLYVSVDSSHGYTRACSGQLMVIGSNLLSLRSNHRYLRLGLYCSLDLFRVTVA